MGYKVRQNGLTFDIILILALRQNKRKLKNMKKLIEKYWKDMFVAIETSDKTKITQNFAPDAVYKFRPKDGIMQIAVEDIAEGCLEYKDTMDCKYSIERVDELADGLWVSIVTSSVSGKPYFVTSYFKFNGDKIAELVEYYGDFE